MKIKQGDTVIVISGNKANRFGLDKNGAKAIKTGKVIKAYPRENKVLVEGVNIVKIHERPKGEEKKGSIRTVEKPIDVSKVALFDPKSGKRIKIGYSIIEGQKVRIDKATKKPLDAVIKK